MNIQVVRRLLSQSDDQSVKALLRDEETVFWVDWQQEEETIADDCETILKTGSLAGELVELDRDEGYEVYFRYLDRRAKVPLTYSRDDRHIGLLALNEILRPDFEIRFCTDSAGADMLAFLPLPVSQWSALEEQFGDAVSRHFRRITPKPNLFTDPLET